MHIEVHLHCSHESDSESSLTRLSQSQKAEFTRVIEYFWIKSNEVSGLYGKTRSRQATLEQFVVLANLESMNALFIQQGMEAPERLKILNQQAIQQMRSLLDHAGIKKLKE